MADILGPNGLPLRATRPRAADNTNGGWFIQSITGNQDADRWTAATDDPNHWTNGVLASFDRIYRTQPAVYSVVNKLARRVSTLPVEGYRVEDRDHRQPLEPTDALATLLRRPWTRRSTVDLLTRIMQDLLIHGNALVVKVRSGGQETPPDMLWPLTWPKLSAYASDGNPIVGWSTTQFGGQERWINPEDVVHFAWEPPDDTGIGISPLEALGTTVRLEDATQRYQTAQFRNGNRPSLAVSLDVDNPRRELLDYARERVEAMHKGADNAGRTFFTGANTRLTPLSLTPVEAALIDQRKLNREEVGMVYDLAGPLMNDLTHGTYSNVEELQKSLYRDVVPPWTTLIVETLQAQLIDLEEGWLDRVVRFDFTDRLRGAPLEMSQAMRSDVEGGLRTRNEARRQMGLPPYDAVEAGDNPADQMTVAANNQGMLADLGKDTAADTPSAPSPDAERPVESA
jgi:HK97 family phage portal protein